MKRSFWLLLMVVGAVIFILSLFPKKGEVVLRFLLRVVAGVLGIYFLNQWLAMVDSSLYVGMNCVTVGMIGFLGLPGFVVVYAISLLI